MGARADFYVGRGQDAEWLGSIAWDGNPSGLEDHQGTEVNGKIIGRTFGGSQALTATTEADFRQGVAQMRESRDDFTAPERGWPWPWETSATTDYAYAFDAGEVYASSFGSPWFKIDMDADYCGEPQKEDEYGNELDVPTGPSPVFPNMRDRQNVRFDRGSGVIVV